MIQNDIIPFLKNFKTSLEHIEQFTGIIKENLILFMTSFESFSDTTIKFQNVIKQYFESANLYLTQIRDALRILQDLYYPNTRLAPLTDFKYDIKAGWHSFWSTFRYKKFDEVLLDVHNKIQDEVNPLSEKNKGEFDSNIEKLKSDTAVGSALELKDGIQNLYSNISGATPTASLNVNLLPVKFYGASVPAKTIKIDFSWYAPYRDTSLSLWRFFLWIGYLYVLFKQIPSILQGFGLITDHRIEMQDIAINDHMADDYYQMLVNNNGVDDIRPKS